jgi:hypothetical protein
MNVAKSTSTAPVSWEALFPLPKRDSVAHVSVTTMSPARCRRSDDVVADLRRPLGLPSPSVTKGGASAVTREIMKMRPRSDVGWRQVVS